MQGRDLELTPCGSRPGFVLAESIRARRPAFTGDKAAGRRSGAQSRLGDLQERLFAETKGGARARCCWCCRGWTPPARAGSCATSSGRSTRRA